PSDEGAGNMLNLIYNEQLRPTAMQKQDQFHEQFFFIVMAGVGHPAFENEALKQRFGAFVADGRVNLNDGDMRDRWLHLREMVKRKPIQVGRLAHPRRSTEQEIALLSKRAVGTHLCHFVIEATQVRGHDEQKI